MDKNYQELEPPLRSCDKQLCIDPYYTSSTAQIDGGKDHIKKMEENLDRDEQDQERFINVKEAILQLYTELQEEPLVYMA